MLLQWGPVRESVPPVARSRPVTAFSAGVRLVGVSDSEQETTAPGRPCPHCGETMVHRHCEYVCPQHGVVFDCADTFY